MTDDEWRRCTDPDALLRAVRLASGRKLRLVACGVARLVAPPEAAELLAVGERAADGAPIPDSARTELQQKHTDLFGQTDWYNLPPEQHPMAAAFLAAQWAAIDTVTVTSVSAGVMSWASMAARGKRSVRTAACDVIREMIGPPSHPLVLLPTGMLLAAGDGPAGRFRRRVSSTARAIAEGVYTDAAFDRLPVLADALEEAGLDDAAVLAHLRQPGGHARGCWALDLVLGKA